MLLALLFLTLPLLLGRVFCGYVCPLGFIIELLGPRKQKLAITKTRDFLLKVPIFVLIICAGFLLFGSTLYLVFDPLSLLTRTSATILYPFLDIAARLTGDILYLIKPLQGTVDIFTNLLSGILIFQKPLSYQLQLSILAMFLLIIGLSFWLRRLWCRHLCPLGAFMGFISRFSLFGRVVDENKCIKCLKCESACPIDAVREEGLSTDKSRCELSFECADVCPQDAVHFGLRPRRLVYNPGRRAFIAVTGITVLSGFFLSTSISREEKDFNVLQPSLWAAGMEGLFTPQMNYDHGYCDWSCNECGKVCPTGAINFLPLSTKREIQIGRAYIDRNRCIPWVDFKNCLVCQELCPIPNKAIYFEESTVKNAKGKKVVLKRPLVIAESCTGCGICQFNCPVSHQSAITVRAAENTPTKTLKASLLL